MDKRRDMIMALDCWRRAMQLRYESTDFPLEKPTTQSPIASYVDATEVCTFEQLEELISDPDEMKMQALLVRERILGPGHPDTVYYIRYRGATYADNNNFDRCIQLWMYALDVQQRVQEPLSPMTQSSLLAFAELFSYMMSEAWSFARGPLAVSLRDILQVFERAMKEIKTGLEITRKPQRDDTCQFANDPSQFHRTLIITMHLIGLMCRLQPHLNNDEELKLKKAVYHLVRLNPKARNGWTPLHLACFKDSSALGRYPVFTFPSAEVVGLLLEVGASPNVLDVGHNTPLHIAALNKPCSPAVFKSLLKHGAHLDLCNLERLTPLQLAQNTPLLDIYPLRYLNLQCLCAQVVQKYKIEYKGFVHKVLEEFIDAH